MRGIIRVGILTGGSPLVSGGAASLSLRIGQALQHTQNFSNLEILLIGSPADAKDKAIDSVALPGKAQRLFWFSVSAAKQMLHVIRRSRIGLCRLEMQAAALDHLLEKERIDILWSLEPLNYPVKIPFITPVWDLQHIQQPWFPELNINGYWSKREKINQTVLKRASRIIAGTSIGKTEICDSYGVPQHKVAIIPFPAPSVEDKLEVEKSREALVIFYPAQFWPHKHHITLLRATKRLSQILPKIKIVFTGSDKGNLEFVLANIRQMGLETFVEVKGFVSESELDRIYRECDVVAFPSLFGPDNLPPLEAMAYGKPVVVADVPGAREQLGDAARYFPPLSAENLAAELEAVAKLDSDISAMILKGHDLVAQRSAQNYVATCLELISDLSKQVETWKFQDHETQ